MGQAILLSGSSLPLSPVNRPRDLDLAVAAVYIDLDACNVGRILRGQECHHACDFLRLSEPLHRNLRKELLRKLVEDLLWQPGPPEDRRDNWPWRDRIDTDAAPYQFRGYGSCQRTQCRFGCRVRGGPRTTFLTGYAGIQDDRRAVIQKWQRFLDGEIRSLDVDIKLLVI